MTFEIGRTSSPHRPSLPFFLCRSVAAEENWASRTRCSVHCGGQRKRGQGTNEGELARAGDRLTLTAVISDYKRRRALALHSFLPGRVCTVVEKEREEEREIIYNPILLGDINKAGRARTNEGAPSTACSGRGRSPLYVQLQRERETVRELRDSPSSVTRVVRPSLRPPGTMEVSGVRRREEKSAFSNGGVGKERQTRCARTNAGYDRRSRRSHGHRKYCKSPREREGGTEGRREDISPSLFSPHRGTKSHHWPRNNGKYTALRDTRSTEPS